MLLYPSHYWEEVLCSAVEWLLCYLVLLQQYCLLHFQLDKSAISVLKIIKPKVSMNMIIVMTSKYYFSTTYIIRNFKNIIMLPSVYAINDIANIIDYFSWLFRTLRAGVHYIYATDKSYQWYSPVQDKNNCTKEVLRTPQFWCTWTQLESRHSQ